MTLHLKDRELEEMLIERFPAFLYDLDKACKKAEYFNFSVRLCRKGFSFYTDDMTFNKDEIEEIPEYNPNDWNEYPAVTPPEGVWMRVEAMREDCVVMHLSFLFENGVWVDENGTTFNLTKSMCARFRPWED